MAMHQTAQFLYAMSAVCRNSYSPPVAMPRAMEIGMHVAMAVFFFFITHARHGGTLSTGFSKSGHPSKPVTDHARESRRRPCAFHKR